MVFVHICRYFDTERPEIISNTHPMEVNFYNDEISLRHKSLGHSRIKDSALLFIVFAIGLTGLVYIMHQSVTKGKDSTTYSIPVGDPDASDESIYLTSNR